MTNEEMIKLARAGDLEIVNTFFKKNQRLAYYIARKFEANGYEIEELASVAKIGLVKAFNTFNLDKAIKFATYGTRVMTNEILMFLRKNDRHKQVDSLQNIKFTDRDGNGLSLEDVIADDKTPDSDVNLVRESLIEMTKGFLETLTDREQDIFISLVANGKESQQEVATRWNISQSYISRIDKNLRKKYQRYAQKVGFAEGVGINMVSAPRKKGKERNVQPKLKELKHIDHASLSREVIPYISSEEKMLMKKVKTPLEITKENYERLRAQGITNKQIAFDYFCLKNDGSLYTYLKKWRVGKYAEQGNEQNVNQLEIEKLQGRIKELESILESKHESIPAGLPMAELMREILNGKKVRMEGGEEAEKLMSALDLIGADYQEKKIIYISLRQVG